MQKEKVSLEDILNQKSFFRERLGSDSSDKIIVLDKELAQYFCSSPNAQTKPAYLLRGQSLDNVKQMPQSTQSPSPALGAGDLVAKDILDQNQRRHKEALNDFKKMVHSELESDNGTIVTVDDDSSDDLDSMDTDSLVNVR